MGRRRCGAINPPAVQAALSPGVLRRRAEGPDGRYGRGSSQSIAGPSARSSTAVRVSLPDGERDERTTTGDVRGANLKHRARDAMETADLRHYRTSTSLDVARRRGPRVRQDPGVPRALGFEGRGRKYGLPGAGKECGRRRAPHGHSGARAKASEPGIQRPLDRFAIWLWIPGPPRSRHRAALRADPSAVSAE